MLENTAKKIAFIGLDPVGLLWSTRASRKGYSVIGIDKDDAKARLINAKESPYNIPKLVSAVKTFPLEVYSDFSKIKYVDYVVAVVDAAVSGETLNIEAAMTSVARNIMPGQLIVLKSNIDVSLVEKEIIPLIENISDMQCGKDFHFAFCSDYKVTKSMSEQLHVVKENNLCMLGDWDRKSIDDINKLMCDLDVRFSMPQTQLF